MKKQNQKPTAFEIAYLVIEAIVAISTLDVYKRQVPCLRFP